MKNSMLYRKQEAGWVKLSIDSIIKRERERDIERERERERERDGLQFPSLINQGLNLDHSMARISININPTINSRHQSVRKYEESAQETYRRAFIKLVS